MDIMLIIGRLLVGAYFITHGMAHFTQKESLASYASSRGMKSAPTLLTVSGVGVIAAGAGIVLGVFPGLALLGLAVFLILTSFMVHNFWRDDEPVSRLRERMWFEANLALAGALIMAIPFVGRWTFVLLG